MSIDLVIPSSLNVVVVVFFSAEIPLKMSENTKQARVILWGVPRSISTSFLKCLTFVEDSVCWHEPYLYANMTGTDGTNTPFTQKMMKEMMVSRKINTDILHISHKRTFIGSCIWVLWLILSDGLWFEFAHVIWVGVHRAVLGGCAKVIGPHPRGKSLAVVSDFDGCSQRAIAGLDAQKSRCITNESSLHLLFVVLVVVRSASNLWFESPNWVRKCASVY